MYITVFKGMYDKDHTIPSEKKEPRGKRSKSAHVRLVDKTKGSC